MIIFLNDFWERDLGANAHFNTIFWRKKIKSTFELLFWKQRIRAQKVFGFELFAMHQNERINDHPNDACMVILKLFDANITSKCIVKYSACIWWEKSPQSVAYSQTQFATLSQNDVKNVTKWWILMLRENAEFWFKKVQNAWIHSSNWFTF